MFAAEDPWALPTATEFIPFGNVFVKCSVPFNCPAKLVPSRTLLNLLGSLQSFVVN